VLIENATAEVHDARQRHLRDQAHRTRLRRLVSKVDVLIEACEEAHLQGLKDIPAEIATATTATLRTARRVVATTGDQDALRVVEDMCARPRPKITDAMDALWTVQEAVFDVMLPWRSELPEDVELPGTPHGPWRYDSAA
jgi:hypothetical protein